MKIALIIPGGVDRSGEYRVIPAVLSLLRRLTTRHEVHVVAFARESSPASWEFEGACIHNVGPSLGQWRAISAVLAEHRSQPFDIVHSLWAGRCGFVAVAVAKLLRVPSMVHLTGGEAVALPEINYGGRLDWKRRLREDWILRQATVVTATSSPLIERIAILGRVAQRVPLGVDLQAWPASQPVRRAPDGQARLIHVGSLNLVKDQGTLLHALAALSAAGGDFHLDLVGEDTLRGAVQRLAQRLGLAGRITFHGFLTQRQLRPVFERAHVNIVSSLHEAGPFVLLEAAAVGVPTVGTAVGHIAEWAPTAALAVPVANPAKLAAAIGRVIEDEDLRLRIAAEALRRASSEDADFTAAQFDSLYAKLAGRQTATVQTRPVRCP